MKMINRANEKEVMDVYSRISPSALPVEKDKEMFAKVHKRTKDIYFHRLKFPLSFYQNINYVNFGCGSGEQDIIYASWGAKGVGIDLNPISVNRANELKRIFKLEDRLSFHIQNVMEPALPSREFDWVNSDGVINHVEDPEKMLVAMARHVKKEGFLTLGCLDQSGNVQRLIHGVISRMLAKNRTIDEVENIAYTLFKEHLDRCSHFGGRTVQAVINDYIINKHSYGIDLVNIIKILKREGLDLHTSYPLNLSLINTNPTDHLKEVFEENEIYYRFQQIAWMFGTDYNEWNLGSIDKFELLDELDRNILDDINSGNSKKTIEKLKSFVENVQNKMIQRTSNRILNGLDELSKLLEVIKGSAFNIQAAKNLDFQILFKGFNGFSTCYMSFYKE